MSKRNIIWGPYYISSSGRMWKISVDEMYKKTYFDYDSRIIKKERSIIYIYKETNKELFVSYQHTSETGDYEWEDVFEDDLPLKKVQVLVKILNSKKLKEALVLDEL